MGDIIMGYRTTASTHGNCVAVVVGIALTLSSAAVAQPRSNRLAGGAALAGCCAQMVGFAVAS